MVGSQKVLGMVALHWNDKTYSNAYLITLEVGPFRTHPLVPSTLLLLEALAEGFFWNLPEFGHHIRFYVLHNCEIRPLETHFQSRNSQKSLGARSKEYGCWMMTGIAAQQPVCGSVHYHDTESTAPATCCTASSESRCATSTNLARRKDQ
jgi:hypothetical protein